MNEIEIEGKTIEEAIQEGLAQLGCSKENVEIKILNEGTAGLFGLMGNKPARVLLSLKSKDIDYAEVHAQIKKVLADLLQFMGISFKTINTALLTGRFMAEIKSDDSRFIIGKNGQTLDALEHVLNLILNKNEKTRVKVSLDTEGYRKQQESRLEGIAEKAAAQVIETGKPYRFEPMSAKDRRIIHIALKNNPAIETVSEGEGMFRKVVLNPKK